MQSTSNYNELKINLKNPPLACQKAWWINHPSFDHLCKVLIIYPFEITLLVLKLCFTLNFIGTTK